MSRLLVVVAFTLATWMGSVQGDTPAPFDCNAPTDYICNCELIGKAWFDSAAGYVVVPSGMPVRAVHLFRFAGYFRLLSAGSHKRVKTYKKTLILLTNLPQR